MNVTQIRAAARAAILMSLMSVSATGVAADVAATSITVQQRVPWDGKVEIAVTFTGASNDVANATCTFVATNSATKAALNVAHLTVIKGAIGSGTTWQRRLIWDATADLGEVKIDDVVLTVIGPDLNPEPPSELGGVQLWKGGPYWAECNVGATKPEEYGYYFWWGDTVGYKRNAGDNGWAPVKNGASFSFTDSSCPTYYKATAQIKSAGYIDSNGNLSAAHDAATAHLGAPWRMPTSAEFSTLLKKCTTTWETRNGVTGRRVTGKGAYASKSIFLPAAGNAYESDLYGAGADGYYWSSTPGSDYVYSSWYLGFDSGDIGLGYGSRDDGQSVRPLRALASGPRGARRSAFSKTSVVRIRLPAGH